MPVSVAKNALMESGHVNQHLGPRPFLRRPEQPDLRQDVYGARMVGGLTHSVAKGLHSFEGWHFRGGNGCSLRCGVVNVRNSTMVTVWPLARTSLAENIALTTLFAASLGCDAWPATWGET